MREHTWCWAVDADGKVICKGELSETVSKTVHKCPQNYVVINTEIDLKGNIIEQRIYPIESVYFKIVEY